MNNWKPLTALFHCLCHPFAQQPLQPAAKCKEMDKTLPARSLVPRMLRSRLGSFHI